MLQGSATKLAIWFVTIAGLIPVLLLALMAILLMTIQGRTESAQPGVRMVLRENHHLELGLVGSKPLVRLESWHPRVWVGVVLMLGVSLIVFALVFLLHVPEGESS